jgi:cobalamin synthase
VTAIFRLLTAALNAYIEHVRLQRDRHLDALEDRLDALASIGTPADKLLIERVAQRIERERKRPL